MLYGYFRVLLGLKREAHAVIYKLSSRFNSLADALEQDSLKINARTWCDQFNKDKNAVDCITRFWENRSSVKVSNPTNSVLLSKANSEDAIKKVINEKKAPGFINVEKTYSLYFWHDLIRACYRIYPAFLHQRTSRPKRRAAKPNSISRFQKED